MLFQNLRKTFRPALCAAAAVVVALTAGCTAPAPSSTEPPTADTPPAAPAAAPSAGDPWRPAVHLSTDRNWINDPNGLVYDNGTYHAFYQHNPHGNSWGNMSWGHSTSTDLIHWTQQPVAMEASEAEEIFSGSIVMDKDNASGLGTADNPPMVALYTSAYGKGGARPAGIQAQSLAYSLDHGKSWQKYKGNPVLDLAPSSKNFRDPKLTWYAPGKYWVMTTVVADAQTVKLFKSTDLLHWDFLSDFSGVGAHGGLWEVPELLQMDVTGSSGEKKWVMLISINPGGIAGGSGMQYFVGEFDGRKFTAENAAAPGAPLGDSQWLDYGADYYAANSINGAPGGKPVLLGWMGNWDYAQHVPTTPWRGSMAVPRELELVHDGGRYALRSGIAAAAAEALGKAAGGEVRRKDLTVTGSAGPGYEPLGGEFAARTQLLDVELEPGASAEAGLVLRGSADGTRGLRISYERETGTLKVDRSSAGTDNFSPLFSPYHRAPVALKDGKLRLRILLDSSSVEVFTPDGTVAMTDSFYPAWDDTETLAFSRGGPAKVTIASSRVAS